MVFTREFSLDFRLDFESLGEGVFYVDLTLSNGDAEEVGQGCLKREQTIVAQVAIGLGPNEETLIIEKDLAEVMSIVLQLINDCDNGHFVLPSPCGEELPAPAIWTPNSPVPINFICDGQRVQHYVTSVTVTYSPEVPQSDQ